MVTENGLVLTQAVNFVAFGECVAWWSWMMRIQLIYSTATNDVWAAKHMKAYSATARLRVVAQLCNAEDLKVLSEESES